MKKTHETKCKGITLIALVITIIIMLILVVVTIFLTVNGGLFEYAGIAKRETENKRTIEQDYANVEQGLNTSELISVYTDYGAGEYSDNKWEYAWTYSTLTNQWSETYTQSNKPASFSGSIVAKVFEKDEGYHLIIEKIGETGAMGDLSVISCNTMLAMQEKILKDSSQGFLIGWRETAYAWNQYFDCSLITKVYIGDGVTSIGRRAFQSCTSLTSIEIPNTVTSIREYAFTGCSALETITFKGTESEWTAITKSGTFEIDIECTDGICHYEGVQPPKD